MFNKRIWLTGALCIIAIFAVVKIQQSFRTGNAPPSAEVSTEEMEKTPAAAEPDTRSLRIVPAGPSDDFEKEIRLETETYDIRFSNRGGTITSLILKDYSNSDGSPVDLVLTEDSGSYPFTLQFGEDGFSTRDILFTFTKSLGAIDQVIFEHKFRGESGEEFILRKIFSFTSDDYLIRLSLQFENLSHDVPYLVEFGPQIGPAYRKLDGRSEYRYFSYLTPAVKRTLSSSAGKIREADDFGQWGGIEGKYFTVLGIPQGGGWSLLFDSRSLEGIRKRCSFLFIGQAKAGTAKPDTIYYYAGPKKEEILSRYSSPETNSFGVDSFSLVQVLPRQRLIARFAGVLKVLLNLFYAVIPNYGVAIILMALVIRVAFFPLSLNLEKGKEKMKSLSARVEEIKAEYSYDQQKVQQEVGNLYREHNVRPMGRAWPLIIQLPIIIALYGLLNTHFDLRGAGFLRSWLTDLSAPDVLIDFYPKRLPFLGWEGLRLLPFMVLGLMLVQSRYTQPPDEANRAQNIMAILFPVIIFIILYNVPSGLLLYWTAYTILGIFQDLYLKRRRAHISPDSSRA